jgi:hypothetical protein
MHLYHNWIECHCKEAVLTVKEEERWDPDDANIDINALSDSDEESKEHNLDDINFYSEVDDDTDDNNDDDEDNKDDNDNNGLGNSKEIAKLEHEIRSLRTNVESDLVIL